MRVRFTPSARREFLDAVAYIKGDDPGAARKFRARAEHVLRRLENFPDSGRPIPEFSALPHREVIVRSYRFFYRVDGRTVWIVALWHAAQDVKEPEVP